ncbi:MAG: TraG family conjugative transposon ATPase [Sphingobacterium sp.]
MKRRAVSWDKLMPIMGVEYDCILSKQGDMTVGFEAMLPEVFTLSDQEYEAFHHAFIKAIKVLPKGSVFQKQDWFLETCYTSDFESKSHTFLSKSSEHFFNERPYLNHRSYIFLTKKPSARRISTSSYSSILMDRLVPQETLDHRARQAFLDVCGQFQQILQDSGFVQLRRLKADDLTSTVERTGLIEQYCLLKSNQKDRMLYDWDLSEGLRIGDQETLLFALSDAENLPPIGGSRINYERYSTDRSKFSVGFASSLGHLLPCNHVYTQYIVIEDIAQTIKKLETRRLRLQSLASYSRENLVARDATNDFLNEAVSRQRLPVKAHFNVLAWTDNQDRVKEIKNMVSSAFAQMDTTAKLETVGAAQIVWAGIPGNAAEIPQNETFDTFLEHACCFLNMETSYQTSASPTGIRLGDRLTGRPIHVDISDEPMKRGICTNRNKFILGPSGSGKSFFTNHMVRCYYEQGTHVVLVDVGHSYKGLCQLVGGYYFTYSESDPIRFNPFFIGPNDELDTEKKESIKTLLLALWKKDDEEFKRSEYVAISNAVRDYYHYLEQHPEVFPSFDSFYAYLCDEFMLVLARDKVKDRDFDFGNFLYVLRPYYKGGEFDYLLNAKENLDLLNERFIVFELDRIKDHPILFPVVTIIIMEVFISKMRKIQGVRKMILIEEAWKALMKEGFAQYVQYLFKTVRKFYGEAVVVTQEVEDIISSPIVKQTIINNSDCKILLDQSKYQNKFEEIQQLLGLSDKDKALVLSVNRANELNRKYKEVFINLGGAVSKVYRTEVSLEEYLTYTTEQSEQVALAEYLSQTDGHMQRAITLMAEKLREAEREGRK